MTDTRTVPGSVVLAAEHVRQANHAGMAHRLTVPDVYDTAGHLVDLAHRLPQLLDHLTRTLRRADPVAHFDDRGTDPARALALADGHLVDARGQVDEITRQLVAAHNHLGHLGLVAPED